ncbi:MAG: hypothetical protein ACE5HI_13640, partial [bacterium]
MEETTILMDEDRQKFEEEVTELIELTDKGEISASKIVDRLKYCFHKLRPLVPLDLACFLADQQIQLHSTGANLFEEPEEELAVWAYAHAYGWQFNKLFEPKSLQERDIKSILPDYLQKYDKIINPIFPQKLNWDAAAHLQDKVVASLDSPIIHAWFLRNKDTQFTNVIITGKGIPLISEQLTAVAFATSIALAPKENDLILDGIIRLSARQESNKDLYATVRSENIISKILPAFLQKTFGSSLKSEQIHLVKIPSSTATAMDLLKGALDRLQHDTGFVQVNVLSEEKLHKLQQSFSDYNNEAADNDVVYLWNGNNYKNEDSLVTTFSYDRIPWIEGPIELTLPIELIETEEFKELITLYQNSIIGSMIADAERRQEFYQGQYEKFKNELNYYESLSESERKKLEPVEVSIQIDWELGIEIQIRPVKVPAESYYKNNVPNLMDQAKEWYEKMRIFRKNLEPLIENPSAPLNRICTARLFDCALREIEPTGEPYIKKLFYSWKKCVEPLLLLEWNHLLNDQQINPENIFTRHTLFNIIIDSDS